MRVAILTPQKYDRCESFVRHHIDNLPFQKTIVYGGELPHMVDGKKLSYINRIAIKLRCKIGQLLKSDGLSYQELMLQNILKKNSIDIVFCEYLFTGANAMVVCRRNNIPLVCTALGYDVFHSEIYERYEKKYLELFDYVKTIIAVSSHMKNRLVERGCDEDRIKVSAIGADEVFFQLHPALGGKKILAVGRFVDKKAPHLLIMAFKEVLKVHPDARLKMVGDGPLLNACIDLVNAFGIEGNVDFQGKLEYDEYLQLLENTDIFVQHSKEARNGDCEGTPQAIIEASASGIPVVSTFHAGIPDVIHDSENGYLVSEGDWMQMGKKIISLLDSPPTAIEFGKNSRERMQKYFRLQSHIDLISEQFEFILSGPR